MSVEGMIPTTINCAGRYLDALVLTEPLYQAELKGLAPTPVFFPQ